MTSWLSITRIVFILNAILFAGAVMAIEEPQFTLLEKTPPFELRSYAPMILAEVQVEGDLDEASSQGFRLIAAYIFGQNQVSEKIAMTAPVAVEEPVPKSTKIAMTAPVNIEAHSGKWTVSFVMPAQYTMESLPKPLNPRVQIRQIPAVKRAVILFSGFYSENKVAEKTLELEQWIKTKNLQSIGAPKFARYNPPWTLPFLRRNEVMIDVRDSQ
jgi:SOUL heme-binding protein